MHEGHQVKEHREALSRLSDGLIISLYCENNLGVGLAALGSTPK